MSDEIPLEPFPTDETSQPDSDEIPLEPEPKKKPRLGEHGAPLPRLWKVEPDEDPREKEVAKKAEAVKKAPPSEPLFDPRKAKKAKEAKEAKKRAAKEGKDGGKGVLVEETPEVDTYEYRQRVRMLVGGIGLGAVLLFGFVVVMMFAPPSKVEEPEPDDLAAAVTQKSATATRALDETEAKSMYERARDAAKNGKVELAISFLNTVANKYPATKAAKSAREALENTTRNLPLFSDAPAMVANLGNPNPSPSATPSSDVPPRVDPSRPGVLPNPAGTEAVNATATPNPPEPVPVATRASRPLPAGFRPRSGTEIADSGWPLEIVGDRDDSTLVLVPGGIFNQGRDDSDPSETPLHQVRLSTYYIDKHEVTNRQFDLYERDKGQRSERARALVKEATLIKADNFPAVMVTAKEAKEYADWAGKTLPTEAQWEIAGRTSDGRVYPWGPTPPSWSKPRGPKQIDAVMAYPEDVSAYGVFDLSGNAWEWTRDWFDSRYYYRLKNSITENPAGPTSSRLKQVVVKGGDKDWGLTRREGLKVDSRLPYLGFRCVLQVEGPGNALEPKAPPKPAGGQPNVPANGPGGDAVPF